jgi:hypothetical protein
MFSKLELSAIISWLVLGVVTLAGWILPIPEKVTAVAMLIILVPTCGLIGLLLEESIHQLKVEIQNKKG